MNNKKLTEKKLTDFQPEQFADTPYMTAIQKAKLANQLVDFIAKKCPQSDFKKPFYVQLSFMFGFTACYSIDGFYGTWLVNAENRMMFMFQILQANIYGDPKFTVSDVEKAVQNYLRDGQTEDGTSTLGYTGELVQQYRQDKIEYQRRLSMTSLSSELANLTDEQRAEVFSWFGYVKKPEKESLYDPELDDPELD